MNKPTISDAPIKKIYWNVHEVAQELKVNCNTIYYWEEQFNLNFRRSQKSWTILIDERQLQALREICFLIKVEGFTIWGAKRKLEGHDN